MNKKALVAMSGGVDSSVAAYLMKNDGYDISGAIMRLYDSSKINFENNINDAKNVCQKLEIPFYVFELEDEFKTLVIEKFIDDYEKGLTPNPCVVCNKNLKFGQFLSKAEETNHEYIVTGHYANIEKSGERYLLKKGRDVHKDQSYFLYHLTQHQLSHTKFPLGNMSKDEIREIAESQNLITARKKDSQDICFVPDGDYVKIIKEIGNKTFSKGNFVNAKGDIIGTHPGHINYTIGQRKGLGTGFGQRVYVLGKDAEKNEVILGNNEELFSSVLIASDFNWIISDNPPEKIRASVKIRYSAKEAPAMVYTLDSNTVEIRFDEPQRAVAPGQAVVLYDGDLVLGGGTIN